MVQRNEAFTSINETIKNRRLNPSLDALNESNDNGNIVMEMVENLPEWSILYSNNLPEIKVLDLLEKLGIPEGHADALFQIFKLRDFKGQWSEDMRRYGLVFSREYESYYRAWQVRSLYKYDQLSSHGHEFLLHFFEKTKNWFELE